MEWAGTREGGGEVSYTPAARRREAASDGARRFAVLSLRTLYTELTPLPPGICELQESSSGHQAYRANSFKC